MLGAKEVKDLTGSVLKGERGPVVCVGCCVCLCGGGVGGWGGVDGVGESPLPAFSVVCIFGGVSVRCGGL